MLFYLLAATVLTTSRAFEADKVISLPGLHDTINFDHFSGYLNASEEKFLHYWFTESQNNPSEDPILLWLNGGPGCSSLGGLLMELGPFHVKPNGKDLYLNPFAWNKVANVIFLEAPAGVGYSYSTTGKYATDDDTVANDNYRALLHFFQKFPQFRKNDLYITGESYGGIYVPTLTLKVLQGQQLNLKGFMVGNGYLDRNLLPNSIVFFANYHGLIGQTLWKQAQEKCCTASLTRTNCEFVTNVTSDCKKAVTPILQIVQDSGLNIYNLYSDCASSSVNSGLNSRDVVDKRTILKSFPFFNQYVTGGVPCVDVSNVTNYLNTPAVRQALHIPDDLPNWELCSDAVERGYSTIYNSMKSIILQLINSGKLRGLIYNGDVDMACNFLGDEWFFEDLGYEVTKEYQPWNLGRQIAGFTKSYDKLSYLTIKGSGHLVPQDKPAEAFKMATDFLHKTGLFSE